MDGHPCTPTDAPRSISYVSVGNTKISFLSCGVSPIVSEKGSRECRGCEDDDGGCTEAARDRVSLMFGW